MTNFTRYPSYKDSGIEWLGEIPAHWEIKKLKFIVKEYSGNGFPVIEQGNVNGNIPFYKVSDMNSSDTFIEKSNNYVTESTVKKMKWNLIPVNSIVTAKIGEALRKNHRKITKVPCIIDNNCIAFEPIKVDIKFNFYLHKIIDFDWFSNIGAVPSISVPQYKNFKIPLPPKDEQTKIASFLDEKTTQINQAIAQKERLVELLKEKKQITINDAVTKGLDKNTPLKDSGVEWLGKIPAHWEVKKLKFVSNNKTTKSFESDFKIALENIESQTAKYIETQEVVFSEAGINFKKGDVLFGKLRPYLAKVYLAEKDGICVSEFLVLESKNIENLFLKYILISSSWIQHINSSTYGTKMPRASWDFIGNSLVPLPPKEEQIQIVEYLQNQTTQIDKAIQLQQNYIAKLKEYKASLIDSVVRGKVRVG